jgi:transcriptional regulator of NAD metabolism
MNERIKALLLNERNMFVNGVTESDNKIYIHGSEENLEKFAELIVKECADIATINAHQWASPGTYVLKHFGVEE